jgi:hypothetical protein
MAFKCVPQNIVDKLKEDLMKGRIGTEEIAKMLPEEKAVLKSLLEDFVSDKMGVSIKETEVKVINEKAKKIQEAQTKLGDDLGNPSKLQENLDFFTAKKEMESYLQGLAPSSQVKVLSGTIGRGMMLTSVKAPILNIGSNIEIGLIEALSRRIVSGRLTGANNKLAGDYIKMVNKVYHKTGYDISRMVDLKDPEVSGGRVLGETVHAEGPGKIRAVGRVMEDITFKQLMGAPDVVASSVHFADSVNLNSLRMTKGNKAKATELMNDAMRIKPQTAEGELLRGQAILDAQTATWTNTTWASKISEGIRKLFNTVSGDARVGDYLLPFIKTKANVVATGMDYAGLGIPKAIIKTVKAIRTGEIGSQEYFKSITRDLVRSGIGLIGGTLLIAGNLDDDDFVGAYDPARAQIEQLKNSNTNSIRVGNKWISTDWLGPFAIPVTAAMYARKYGKTTGEKAFQYGRGIISQAKQIPGIEDIYDYVQGQAYQKNQTLEEMTSATRDYILEQAYSRLIPSLFSDIAKATDVKERQTTGTIGQIMNKIPGLRQTLPEKKNIFGETIIGESAISDILFGSRVKTDKETAIVKEISDVSTAVDKGINFTNWDKSSSAKLAQFKEKYGKIIYEEAKVKYGQELKKLLEEAVGNSGYQKLSAEEKYKIINGYDLDAMDKVFAEYNFQYESDSDVLSAENVKRFQAMDPDERAFLIKGYSETNQKKLNNPDIIFQDKLYIMSGPFSTKSAEEKSNTIKELRAYLDEFDISYDKAKELFLKEAKEQGLVPNGKAVNERLQRLKDIYNK